MAEKSGFWNALLENGVYDRKYNAEDYSDNLAVVISNGVLKSINDDLKVSANGLVVSVGIGRAWINGKYYYNNAKASFAAIVPPTGGKRIDRIILRYNKAISARNITLRYLKGTAANDPVPPAPTRSGDIYDLVLADIFVDANATSVVVTDQRANRDLCGWVYSTSGDNSFFTSLDNSFNEWFANARDTLASVTLFKKYTQNITVQATTSTVSFNIPQYDDDTCFLEVYVNGILDNRHSISGNVITFVGNLVAGTLVTVYCFKSIDGTGIMTVADEITELQNKVDALEAGANFNYKITGLNDNIALSEIAQVLLADEWNVSDISDTALAFLNQIGGKDFFDSLTTYSQITINVCGEYLDCTTPFGGAGTADSRYRWFAFGKVNSTDKKIIFDFAGCNCVEFGIAGNTSNIIFYGTDLNIRNLRMHVVNDASTCSITAFAAPNNKGKINVENCDIEIDNSGTTCIAENGDFTNCRCVCFSYNDVYMFNAKMIVLFVCRVAHILRLQ